MRFGVTLPNLGYARGPSRMVELAVAAEAAGWDGVFVWDTFGGPEYDSLFEHDITRRAPWDPWVLLAAAAAATERVQLGTMVTPVSRRRPWKLASEVATVDQLSAGRVILSVSLGWVPDAAFVNVNEESSRLVRSQRLDEGLAIATAMWGHDRASLDGAHFRITSVPGVPSAQRHRVPIWVVGAWPSPTSMRRALRFDGLIPAVLADDGVTWMQPEPEQLAVIAADVGAAEVAAGYDIVVEGNTSRDHRKGAARVSPYRDAGATWWLEGVWSFLFDPHSSDERMLSRIEAGPPAD
jgi:alkanesulfonate monooxygenase SsuD/methylene tetrahydromethanopterin reductase-like flavin-dependent oxidoreductase (luciferase family)